VHLPCRIRHVRKPQFWAPTGDLSRANTRDSVTNGTRGPSCSARRSHPPDQSHTRPGGGLRLVAIRITAARAISAAKTVPVLNQPVDGAQTTL